MQIRPTEVYNPNTMPYDYDPDVMGIKTFGMKRTTKKVFHPETFKQIVDTVELQNGKKATFTKVYNQFGTLTEKLSTLKDEVGNYVKAKLQVYKDGKVVQKIGGCKN